MKLIALVSLGSLTAATIFLGCSPAADPIAKGGAHYQITYPGSDVDGTCGLISIGGIGDPPPGLPSAGDPPNAWGGQIANGAAIEGSDAQYTIECSITGDSNKSISVTMSGPNGSPQAGQAIGKTGITLNGTVDEEGTGEGTISVRTTTSGVATSQVPCTLEIVENSEDPDELESGDAHLTFNCPNASLSLDQFSICETRGSVYIRDCLDKVSD